MTVFLGDRGRITLRRKGSDQAFVTLVNDSDVRENVRRFSVDFAHEQFITGDSVEIRTVDGTDLNWIEDDDADDSITRFINVDAAGGIRLYRTFDLSIKGELNDAIPLKTPVSAQECYLQIAPGQDHRCLAEVTSYQITTSRETIDTTNLGNHYRRQYESGLIQGQGQIECLWANPESVDCDDTAYGSDVEFTSYLAQLCIRLVHGAAFHGRFYIYASEDNAKRSVWYENETCIVTNVAVTVSPTQIIQTTIDFVTSGPIVLREGYIPAFIELEESEFSINVEEEPGGKIQLEND